MLSYRAIFGASALTFAATMMVSSDGAFRQASEALGIPSSTSTDFSLWDYNPLTLLSTKRVENLIRESENSFPEMKPLYDDPDFKNLNFGDSHLAGVD